MSFDQCMNGCVSHTARTKNVVSTVVIISVRSSACGSRRVSVVKYGSNVDSTYHRHG